MAGYGAAVAFCGVSIAANLSFGTTLGVNQFDKTIYAVAGIAVDVFKMAAPLAAACLWWRQHHILALISMALWCACAAWSLASATGFALATRGDVLASRRMEAEVQRDWRTTVHRAEKQIETLGEYRPSSIIRAEISSLAVPPAIWSRSKHCQDVTLPETFAACARVLQLRRELAAAEVGEQLEAHMQSGRQHLVASPSTVDPQAAALAQLVGVDEASVRTNLALLLAGIVELASSLGFAITALATRAVPVPSAARGTLMPARASFLPAVTTLWRTRQRKKPSACKSPADWPIKLGPGKSANLQDEVSRFLKARTIRAEGATCGATELYQAFRRSCQRQGLPEASQQALGRELTRWA